MNKIEFIIAQEGFKILEEIIYDLAHRFLDKKEKETVIKKIRDVKIGIKHK